MPNLPTNRQQLIFISPGLLIVVISFAAGICLAQSLHLHKQVLVYSVLFLAVFLFVLIKSKIKLHRPAGFFLLGIFFLVLGLHHAAARLLPPHDPNDIYNLVTVKQNVTLEGFLQKYPSVIMTTSGRETRLLMQVKTVHLPSGIDLSAPVIIKSSGLIQLTLKGSLPDDLKPGDRFLARADVAPVSTYSTPGSFNYKRFLAYQSIHITGWIQAPHNITKLHTSGSSPASLSAAPELRYIPERIRYKIAAFINETLPQPARGLYKAILIGDRSDVPASVLENFTAAGCIHILAISGMHMGLLALITIALFTWVLKRSTWLILHAPVLKIAVTFAFLPLLLYALIAGFNIPVLRSLLMTSVFILAILFDKPGNLINHILLAALIILVWKPGAVFTASFQLSFSAVTAIALIYPMLYRIICKQEQNKTLLPGGDTTSPKYLAPETLRAIPRHIVAWIMAGFALTAAAMIGTYPLLLFHFNRFSLVAPLSNLVVEPLVCFWSLITGLAASLCIPLHPSLAKSLFVAGSYGLLIAERTCAFFSALPFASLWLPTPSPAEIILFYLFLISAFGAWRMTGRKRHHAFAATLFFFFSFAAVPVFTAIAQQASGTASVTFLDVGHGSAILLQLPENKTFLIDGGGAETDRFNVGERVIAPFLWNQRLEHLDAVIVTHPHADHYNGLSFILNRFRPRALWVNGFSGHDQEYKMLLDQAVRQGVEIKNATAGETLYESGSTRILCLHSKRDTSYPSNSYAQDAASENPNDTSLVLRLEANSRSFLFPADISSKMADILVNDGKPLKADILMAPHHGSASSMSHDFIRTVAPEFIVISAGRNNPFNIPSKSFYDLQREGIEILSTYKDGTIRFDMKDGEIKVRRYQVN